MDQPQPRAVELCVCVATGDGRVHSDRLAQRHNDCIDLEGRCRHWTCATLCGGRPNHSLYGCIGGRDRGAHIHGASICHNKGDVLLDEATVNALGAALTVKEWRDRS